MFHLAKAVTKQVTSPFCCALTQTLVGRTSLVQLETSVDKSRHYFITPTSLHSAETSKERYLPVSLPNRVAWTTRPSFSLRSSKNLEAKKKKTHQFNVGSFDITSNSSAKNRLAGFLPLARGGCMHSGFGTSVRGAVLSSPLNNLTLLRWSR